MCLLVVVEKIIVIFGMFLFIYMIIEYYIMFLLFIEGDIKFLVKSYISLVGFMLFNYFL